MARNTDTRIVQMQFDNRDFEKNIATSGKSLEKFKENLDFDKYEKGLSSFQSSIKSLTFDTLANNIQKLTDKFTGLGDIGEMVISQLRGHIESLVSKVSNLVDSLGMEQVTAGMYKYGEMNKNVQSIMAATGASQEKVYEVLGRLNEYTDQTSYNFTDMAANIGKFTSVGIPLERAERQMEGIANWAARSGAGISEASRAMYNLSQAMGVGQLKLMDWKSIENAGMATKEFKEQLIAAGLAAKTLEKDAKTGVIRTAKSLGKQVEVTAENLSSSLQKGWATSAVLGDTLEKYYWDDLYYDGVEPLIKLDEEQKKVFDHIMNKGSVGAADWKTLESMNIVTDETKQKLIDLAVQSGKLTKTVSEDGKTVYKAIDKNKKEVLFSIDEFQQGLKAGWLDKSLMENATSVNEFARQCYEAAQKCTTLTDVLGAWKDQLSTGWMKAWQKVFGELGEAMEIFSAICNKVGDSFSEFITTLTGGPEDGKELPGILGAWANMGGRDTLWSLFIGEYDGLYEGAYGLLDVLHDIGSLISGAFWDLAYTVYSALEANPVSKEDWEMNKEFRQEFIGGQIERGLENIKRFVQGIRDFFEAVPTGSNKTRMQMLQEIVTGVAHAFMLGYTAVRDTINFFKSIAKGLEPSFDAILELFASLGLGVTDVTKTALKGGGLKTIFDGILIVIQPLISAFNELVKTITGVFQAFNENGKAGEVFTEIWNKISSVIQFASKVIVRVGVPLLNFLGEVFTTITGLFENGFSLENIYAAGAKIRDAFKTMVNSIFGFDIFGSLEGIFQGIKNVFTSGFSPESIEDLKKKIKAFFKQIFDQLPASVKEGIVNSIRKVKTFFAPFVADVKNVFNKGFSKDSLKQLGDRFKIIARGVFNKLPGGVKEGIVNSIKRIRTFFKPFVDDLKRVFESGFSAESIKKLRNRLYIIIKGVWDKLPKGMKDGIKSAITKVKDFFRPFVEDVQNVFTSGFSKESLERLKSRFKIIFSKVMSVLPEGIKESGSKFITGVKERFGPIVDKILSVVSPIWNTLKDFFVKLFTFFKDFGVQMKDTLKNANLFTLVKESLGLGLLGKFLGGLKNVIKKTNLYTIAMSFLGGYALIKLIQLFKSGSGLFGTAKDFFEGLNDVLSGKRSIKDIILGNKNLQEETEAFGDKLLRIAGGIALIVGAITVMALLPLNKLAQGVIALGVILGLILLFMLAFKKLAANLNQVQTMIRTLLSFGAAMFLMGIGLAMLIAAVRPFSQMNFGQLLMTLLGLAGVLTAIYLFSKSMKGIKLEGMTSLIAISLAIGILVLSIRPLASMKLDQLIKMVLGLAGIAYVLVMFSKNVSFMKGSGMGSLIMVAASIWLVVTALLPLANLEWKDLAKMGAGLLVVLGSLLAFTHLQGNSKNTGMQRLLAVAGSVYTLVESLKPLTTYSWESLAKMAAGLLFLMLMLKNFTQESESMKGTSMVQLIFVAASIWLLLEALKPLATYSWESLAKMAAGMAVMALIVTLMTKFMKTVGNLRESAGLAVVLVGFAAVIVAFGFAMSLLKDVKWDTIAAATLSLILLMSVFVLLMKAMTTIKIKDVAKTISLFGILLALCGVMIVFAIALNKIKDVDTAKIGAFATGLSLIIAAMAGSIAVLSLIQNPAAMFAAIAAIALGIVAVMGALSLMLPMLSDSLGTAVQTVASKLTIVSTMFRTFGMNMNETSEDDLESAKRKFEILIDICKTVVGVEQYYSSIDAFEKAMLKLGTGISLFSSSTADVGDPDNSNALKMIRSFLELKDELAGFSIGDMATQIFGLGEGLALFNFATASFGSEPPGLTMLKGLASEADNLNKLAAVPLDTLKTNLAGLGGALSIYAEGAAEASMIEGGKTPDIQKAVDLMHTVTQSFSGENGKFEIPDIPKEGALSSFGADLAALAIALKKFANASLGLTNTEKAKSLLAFMKDLQRDLTSDSIKFVNAFGDAGIYGTSTLEGFGLKIAALGDAIAKYDQSVSGFKGNKAATDALTFFKELQEDLTVQNLSVVRVFDNANIHEDILTEFATDIAELGTALSSFASNVNFDSDKQEKFASAIEALDDLRTIANTLPVVGGLSGLIHGNVESLGQMSNDIVSIGGALKSFSDALNQTGDGQVKFDASLADSAVGILMSFADMAVRMSSVGIESGDKWWDGYDAVSQLSQFVSYITQEYDDVGKALGGKSMITGLATMMTDIEEAINAAGGIKNTSYFEAFRNMASGLRELMMIDPTLDFEQVGQYISIGLANGITKGNDDVVNAAVAVVNAARKAAMLAADENSPSRIFMEIGDFMTQGLAIGITKGSAEPEKAASKMVDNLLHIGPLANLSALLAGEINPNPTITPVLDLSNVSAGMSGLNSMFGGQYGLGLTGGLTLNPSGSNMMATMANPIDYTPSIESVRTEIGNMRSDLRTLSSAIARTKFVFDSGAVVAAIGPEMDEYLGRQGFYAARTEIP